MFNLASVSTLQYEGGEKVLQISCESAEFKGETTAMGGSAETVGATFNTQLLSGCSCPFSTLRNAKMKFNWTPGTMNASVTSEGPDYRFHCQSPLFGTYQCSYEGNPVEGITLTGGNPAVLAFKEVPMPVTGNTIPCGSEAKLNVEFDVTTPKPLYVSNG